MRGLDRLEAHPEPRHRILVVEDDPELQRVLSVSLAERHYDVLSSATGASAVSLVFSELPALVLLDLGLPDMDGVDVVRRLREHSALPIVVLSGRTAERDLVEALDSGANDFVAKPYRERELFARIRALLRHSVAQALGPLEFGQIRVDPALRRVCVSGRDAKLSATEYRLFAVLLRAGGAAVTHRQLLSDVWGPAARYEISHLRVYMRYLREKLESNPAEPRHLLTESGIGYRLRQNDWES